MNGIAVIGLACRFPGATNVSHFWRNLRDGRESVRALTDEELRLAGVTPELLAHPHYVKAAAVLEDIEQFDARFFGVTPREAEILDVQHRLFLECSWEALEDACCDPNRTQAAIGVYAGAGLNQYLLANLLPQRHVLASAGEFQALISNDKDYLPTRVSYKLNLRGPSVSVQTACSTSLVAIHIAAQALLAGECDVALAGGVSVRVPQKAGYLYQEGMILSPDGHCRAFDVQAAGTVPGSGVGVVVLKRLGDALADRDRIDAVILGSAINNDGAVKVGYTAPSVEGQRTVIREALAVAGVSPDSVGFVEAHGTGTALGDPIEFAALRDAFASGAVRSEPCLIGAVKTNVGHLDTAAGVAGFIKAVLALRHGVVPPTLHFTAPNPQIDLADSGFRINTQAEDWPRRTGSPRRAGVSSFGIGGTNAHVLVEEAPARPRVTPAPAPQLLVCSAHTATALSSSCAALARVLDSEEDAVLPDVAWSLQTGRHPFSCRAALVSSSCRDAARRLDRGEFVRGLARPRSVVFMFPGQGAQVPGMARDLYHRAAVFRDTIDRCCERLRPVLGLDLRELLLERDAVDGASRLKQTAIAQPAIVIVEVALARQLRVWGIEPVALLGHSVGEYAAACIGGSLALDDAIALVAARGRLMQSVPPGRMMSVAAAPERLTELLPEDVSIAAVNADELCVVAGPGPAVGALEDRCTSLGIECRDLRTSHAFHSAMLDPILPEFERVVRHTSFAAPAIPWVSNVTGTWITAGHAGDPTYWAQQARRTVMFARAVDCVMQLVDPVLLEVGPGRTLTTLAAQHASAANAVLAQTMRHERDGAGQGDAMLQALAELWAAGVDVRWDSIDRSDNPARVALPTYPFERQRYWIDAPPPSGEGLQADSAQRDARKSEPAERRRLDEWFYLPVWRGSPTPRGLTASSTGGPWLVFAHDDDDVAAALIARLRREGVTTFVVAPGVEYGRTSETSFVIRPAARDDYERLLAELAVQREEVRHVVHAWSVDRDHGDRARDDPAVTLDRGFFSLVALASALSSRDAETRVHVLSSRIHALAGEARVVAARAALIGPVLVMPREVPHLGCRSIDYTLPPGGAVRNRLVELLYDELRSDAVEPIVAYRANERRVRSIEPIAVPAAGTRIPIAEAGHYLITGGLGGVGLVIAEHLAARRTRLTLLSRTPVANDDPRLCRLTAAGATVTAVAADVGDFDQLRAAVAEAEAQFGAVRGVVHAAGVAGGGLLPLRSRSEMEAVLRPKVAGALNLARVFDDTPLDFLLLMSSLSGIIGEAGQVDYCAANTVLDALAHDLRAAGRNACSVAWDTWQEVGMAATRRLPGALQTLRDETLRLGIRNTEACEVFDRALASGVTQVVVSTRSLGARARDDRAAVERLTRTAGAMVASRHMRPALRTAFVALETPQETALAHIWEALLGVDGIGAEDDFFELGGHSLLATQVLARVRDGLGVRVSLAAFFEHPTIRGIGAIIEARQLEAVLADVSELTDDDVTRELGRN